MLALPLACLWCCPGWGRGSTQPIHQGLVCRPLGRKHRQRSRPITPSLPRQFLRRSLVSSSGSSSSMRHSCSSSSSRRPSPALARRTQTSRTRRCDALPLPALPDLPHCPVGRPALLMRCAEPSAAAGVTRAGLCTADTQDHRQAPAGVQAAGAAPVREGGCCAGPCLGHARVDEAAGHQGGCPGKPHPCGRVAHSLSRAAPVLRMRLRAPRSVAPQPRTCRGGTACPWPVGAAAAVPRQRLLTPLTAQVSLNDFVVRAVALALAEVPAANASWDAQSSAARPGAGIDIAIAVATDKGLITPIVKDADKKSLTQACPLHATPLKGCEWGGGKGAVRPSGSDCAVKVASSSCSWPGCSLLPRQGP